MFEYIDNEFVKNYLSIADNYSYGNDLMNLSSMLVILGQCTRDVITNIRGAIFDNRIHVMCIQKSGSGKGPALDFLKKVATKIGFTMECMTSLTTAGLIGTLGGEEEIIYGPAAYNDILGFQEASILFQKNQSSNDLLYQINQIVDVGGRINKRLARGTISYESNCSLFLTTHPPNINNSDLITSGFMPRLLMCYKDVTSETYEEIRNWMIENIGEEEPKESFNEIVSSLIRARENASVFEYEYEKNAFYEMNKKMKDIANQYSLNTQEYADIYSARMLINGFKIAISLATVDNSNVIDREYARQASEILSMYWKSTLDYIQSFETSKEEKKLNRFKIQLERLFKKFGKELQLRIIAQYTKLSKDKIDVLTDRLIEEDYPIEKEIVKRGKSVTFKIIKI